MGSPRRVGTAGVVAAQSTTLRAELDLDAARARLAERRRGGQRRETLALDPAALDQRPSRELQPAGGQLAGRRLRGRALRRQGQGAS
jgi:hypothetical protein